MKDYTFYPDFLRADTDRSQIFESVVIQHIGHMVMKFTQTEFDQVVKDFALCSKPQMEVALQKYKEMHPGWRFFR